MKKTLQIIILVLVVGGGAFYSGMKYEQRKGNFQNVSLEHSQEFFQGNVTGNFRQGVGRDTNSTFFAGEIIAIDDQSMTLKTQNGSSNIVFFSDSVQILKTTKGSISDISIGEQLTVTGVQNSDGSYIAKSIQIR